MKRILIAILCLVLGYGVASAIFTSTTEQASPVTLGITEATPLTEASEYALELVAPEEAHAAYGNVYVYNGSNGAAIKIYCDFGSSHYETLSKGQNSQQSGKCTGENYDTDQISVSTTKCIKYTGPEYADGWYKLQPSLRVKIPDFTTVGVWDLGYGSPDHCAGRPYYTRRS